ncbi:MAG: ATPase domain-containing protein [Candidatus Bathyarchaeia archaeon]|jgi:KaiC/GvpD/RAD55 family RecA-like ATPase
MIDDTQTEKKQHHLSVESLIGSGVKAVSIKGLPGAGKTTLVLELIKKAAGGLYVSTRVSEPMLIKQHTQFQSLIENGELYTFQPKPENLIYGGQQVTSTLGKGAFRIAEKVMETAQSLTKHLIVLDSWDAFARELDEKERLRVERSLVGMVETNQSKIVFVSEGPELNPLDYLVDAIVELRDEEHEGRRIRTMEWRKLRGTEIPQKKYLFTLADGRFTICQRAAIELPKSIAPQMFKPVPHSNEHYSTGSEELDQLLGGGLRRGLMLLFETGNTVGPNIYVPLAAAIRCNFLAQGGCSVSLPTGGITPEMLRDSIAPHLGKKILDRGLRIGRFEKGAEEPCFFILEGASLEHDFETFWQKVDEVKGESHRPCYISIPMDIMEYTYGQHNILRLMMKALQHVRDNGDVMFLVVKSGSQLKKQLSDICDTHLMIDEVDGTSVLYLVKPPTQLMYLNYDYSEGFPRVDLKLIV